MSNIVIDWFGDSFNELDPLLRKLHQHGGQLTGQVDLRFGGGLAGLLGRRLAKSLGLPSKAGDHRFQVDIAHRDGALHWARQFNNQENVISVFVPHGQYPTGYWSETSGAVSLQLGVDIANGGWYWVQQKLMLSGVSLPLWLFPKTVAYKVIKDGKYKFSVTFSLPLVGEMLSYSGLLQPKPDDLTTDT